MTSPSANTASSTAATAAACPTAIGRSDSSTTRWLPRCRPSATANSQPIAGLSPGKSPRPASATHGQPSVGTALLPILAVRVRLPPPTSRIAIGIRRAVTALQPHLVRSVPFRPIDEELPVERDTSRGGGVELDHPAVDPLRIELRIDRAV